MFRKKTVVKVQRRAREMNLSWPLDESLTDIKLGKLMFPMSTSGSKTNEHVDHFLVDIHSMTTRVLVDKIYRNRKNINYCKLRGIRLSGLTLGRPKKDSSVDKKIEYIDLVDRIEVERAFSLAKRSFGLGVITTKLESTTRSSIVLSIIAMNVEKLSKFFYAIFAIGFSRYKSELNSKLFF